MAEAEADRAMGQAIGAGIERIFGKHRDDGLGVVLDIVCVVAAVALLPTGVGVLAAAGLVGGGILLATDGYAYGLK